MFDTDQLLTINEVAKRTKQSLRFFYNGRSTGKLTLKILKVGSSLRVRESDLNAWLEECAKAKVKEIPAQPKSKASLVNSPAGIVERMKGDVVKLGEMIGWSDHTAMIYDSLDYLAEMHAR